MKKLLLFALLSFLLGCVNDLAEFADDMRVRARIGVMANTEISWITETQALECALIYYKEHKVDAVVITGDITLNGYKNQFEVLDKVWKKVFGGTKVQLIIKDGKYEINGFHFAVSAARPLESGDVLTFSGYGKRALTDELNFYPRESNVVCAGSMRGIKVMPGYYNSENENKRLAKVAQGLFVSAYSDVIEIKRLNFNYKGLAQKGKRRVLAQEVAAPWRTGEALVQESAPKFWDDTKVSVFIGQEGVVPIYTIKWPSVQKRFTGARARHYEVEVFKSDNLRTPVIRRSVLAKEFYLSEEAETSGVSCVFTKAELAKAIPRGGRLIFGVTPIGMFGKHGKTFYTEAVPLEL